MMKRVALAMAGMMVLSLAGCGSSNSNPAAAAGADKTAADTSAAVLQVMKPMSFH